MALSGTTAKRLKWFGVIFVVLTGLGLLVYYIMHDKKKTGGTTQAATATPAGAAAATSKALLDPDHTKPLETRAGPQGVEPSCSSCGCGDKSGCGCGTNVNAGNLPTNLPVKPTIGTMMQGDGVPRPTHATITTQAQSQSLDQPQFQRPQAGEKTFTPATPHAFDMLKGHATFPKTENVPDSIIPPKASQDLMGRMYETNKPVRIVGATNSGAVIPNGGYGINLQGLNRVEYNFK